MRGRWANSKSRNFTTMGSYKLWPLSLLSLALYSFAFASFGVVATSTTLGESSETIAVEAAQAAQRHAADLVVNPQKYFIQIISFLYSWFPVTARRNIGIEEMVQLAVICGAVPCLWLIRSRLSGDSDSRSQQRNQGTRSADGISNIQMKDSHTSARVESTSMSRCFVSQFATRPLTHN